MIKITADEKNKKYAHELVQSIPSKYRKAIKEIIVIKPGDVKSYFPRMDTLFNVIYGWVSKKQKGVIYIVRRGRRAVEKQFLIHELGHIIYNQLPIRVVAKVVKLFDTAYERMPSTPHYLSRSELETSPDEYFASSFAEYIKNKNSVKKYDRELVKVFTQLKV